MGEVKCGAERDRPTSDAGNPDLGGLVEIVAQIMMLAKEGPSETVALVNGNFNFRESPSLPPLEAHFRHVEHPVWIKPVEDVIVTGNGDERRAIPFPNGFGDGGAADLRDGAIYDGGKFIENDALLAGGDGSSKFCAELLAVG